MPISTKAASLIYNDRTVFWSAPAGVGTPAVITYSFLEAPTAEVPASAFSPLNDLPRTRVRQALAAWAQVGGLTFIEVPASLGGDLRFGIDRATQNSGYAYYPSVTVDGAYVTGGDVYFNAHQLTLGENRGDLLLFLHEIGHALGLKHPNEGQPLVSASAFVNGEYTVMAYTGPFEPVYVPQSVDIEAIQYLYGTPAARQASGVTYSFSSASGVLTSTGGTGADRLVGAGTSDVINAGLGNDGLYGEAGSDTLNGEAGNDWIDGGNGNDVVRGGDGNDSVRGLNDDDLIYGEAGDDDVNGNVGQDAVFGGDGADFVRGGQGNDVVYGDDGNDLHVNGNIGNDTVYGGAGNDAVFGGQNDDVLYGDAGNDTLSGDFGNDTLTGGDGADVFVFNPNAGNDLISDFNFAAGDRMQLPRGIGFGIGTGASGAILTLSTGGSIELAGVATASVSPSFIVFA